MVIYYVRHFAPDPPARGTEPPAFSLSFSLFRGLGGFVLPSNVTCRNWTCLVITRP